MVDRDGKGRFVQGYGGGPGRPKGSTDRYAKYRALVDPDLPNLIKKLMAMALEGDVTAARILLDRVWPAQAEEIRDMELAIDELAERLEAAQSGIRRVA
jgi:hypothetical protein